MSPPGDAQAPGTHPAEPGAARDRKVRRLLYLEGAANLSILVVKTVVGISTGSLAVLGDALHSFTDVANNIVALVVMRIATRPPDRDHPYGHRKYETLAVFGLAGLLTVMAIELILRAPRWSSHDIETSGWSLGLMLGVLAANIGIAAWQGRWARRLDSDILRADARHTLGDVLTTVLVITGWQLAAAGLGWMDSVLAIVVALVVLFLAYDLFKRSVPILVDSIALDPEELSEAVSAVAGVHEVVRVRSRHTGASIAVDVVVTVEPELSTVQTHAIADEIEDDLHARFSVKDVSVHIEPRADPLSAQPRDPAAGS